MNKKTNEIVQNVQRNSVTFVNGLYFMDIVISEVNMDRTEVVIDRPNHVIAELTSPTNVRLHRCCNVGDVVCCFKVIQSPEDSGIFDSLKTIQNFAFLPVDEDADREIDKYIKNVYPSRKIFINPANRNKQEIYGKFVDIDRDENNE